MCAPRAQAAGDRPCGLPSANFPPSVPYSWGVRCTPAVWFISFLPRYGLSKRHSAKNCALALSPADVCCDIDLPRRALFGTDKARVMTWALDTQQTQNKATQFQVCFIKLSETGAHTGADMQAHVRDFFKRGRWSLPTKVAHTCSMGR